MADADAQADRQQRAALLAPVFHKACALLLRGVEELGDAGVRQALARMAEDPEERIGCELAGGVSAWDAYQSGGPLEAQFAELLGGQEASCRPEGMAAMLRALSDAGRCQVEATEDPWRFTLHAAGLPKTCALLLPSSCVALSLQWPDSAYSGQLRWELARLGRACATHP